MTTPSEGAPPTASAPDQASAPDRSSAPDRAAVLPPAERGATVIPDKVVARIAARAAKEALAEHADTAAGRMKLAAPQASATVGSGSARLGLTVDLPYPTDLAATSRQVQDYVSERVAHLTGMRVTEVTLAIDRLVSADGPGHRRVQ
ncbi:Asp23/Gls24 family envelope stress response protein [Streptomyces sp. NPDC058701]|uniref:Asp23/Gls24 family envelope stress response protein n=1 Tax=Streptomyces sp. NPDC058701 TaxID=3346608 RepID=UPI003664F670